MEISLRSNLTELLPCKCGNNLATENLIAHASWTISEIRIPGDTERNQKCLRSKCLYRVGVIAKNPDPLIFQWDPGFLFASWPTFDPLFFWTHYFHYRASCFVLLRVQSKSAIYGIIGSEKGQISDPFCFLNSRLFWNWIACLTRTSLSNTILSTCKLTTCRLIK